VLHEAEPFRCVRCGKPFGTLRAIEAMIAKLGGHPAFQGAAAERLKMCGDCRVIDIHTNPNEVKHHRPVRRPIDHDATIPICVPSSFATRDDSEELGPRRAVRPAGQPVAGAARCRAAAAVPVAVTQAPQPGGHLEAPWQDLVAAMRATTVHAAPPSTTRCSTAWASPRCSPTARST
jgi:hypothetical protein